MQLHNFAIQKFAYITSASSCFNKMIMMLKARKKRMHLWVISLKNTIHSATKKKNHKTNEK